MLLMMMVMMMMMMQDDDDDDDDDDQEKDGEEAGAAVQMALGEIQELGGHGQGPETAEAIEVVSHSLQFQCSTINMMPSLIIHRNVVTMNIMRI